MRRTFPAGVDDIARSIGIFLDAVGLRRTAIVGHSWGGGFALRFAELHPDRVDRLALIAPGGLDIRDVWEFRLVRVPLLGEVAFCLTSAVSARHMLRKSFAHRERIPYDRVDDVLRAMRSPGRRLVRLRDMLRVERSVRWADTERDLHLVQAPTLILWGDQDRYFPVSLIDRFTARLPTVEKTHRAWGWALTARRLPRGDLRVPAPLPHIRPDDPLAGLRSLAVVMTTVSFV